MDTIRFDHLTKRLSGRFSRRTALRSGGAGLAAAALGAGQAAAQTSSPVATPVGRTVHPEAETALKPEYLFTQTFAGGSWQPKAGSKDTFTLTLTGAAAETVYFSDRPERVVGLAPTDKFLAGLGFGAQNPPNAALVATPASGGDPDVLVIELFNPDYDPARKTLRYDAKILKDYEGDGLASLALAQTDFDFAASFGQGGLFIDDCPQISGTCSDINTGEPVANVWPIPICWHQWLGCLPCHPNFKSAFYGEMCHQFYPNQCSVTPCSDDSSQICDWGCYISSIWKSKNG